MKEALVLLLGIVGGVFGALGASALGWVGETPPAETAGPPARLELGESDLERLSARVAEHLREAHVPRLEAPPVAPPPPHDPTALAAAVPVEEEAPPADADVPAAATGYLAQLLAVLDDEPYDRDKERRLFGHLAMHPDEIPAAIAGLKAALADDPNNPDLQVALATAYVAELVNATPPGPQQGRVWMKAQAAYDAALKLEPEHWQARFGKAFGTSQIPDFLGQRPEAIRQFEELKSIQERRTPAPGHEETYFHLGSLYKDAGNIERAQQVWREGLARFPEEESLREALQASGAR